MCELSCVCSAGAAGAGSDDARAAADEAVPNDFFLNRGDLGGGDLGGRRRSGGRTGILIFLLLPSSVSIVGALL